MDLSVQDCERAAQNSTKIPVPLLSALQNDHAGVCGLVHYATPAEAVVLAQLLDRGGRLLAAHKMDFVEAQDALREV